MKQVIIGGYNDALSNSADEYAALCGSNSWVGAVANRYQVIPTGGTLSCLSVELSGVPGTNPYLIGVYLNGALTTLAVSIAADGTTGIDTGSVDVAAGDLVAIISTRPSGAPDNTPTARWSVVFTGTIAGESILMSTIASYYLNTYYGPVSGAAQTGSTTESDVYQVIPTGGVLKTLYVSLVLDPGTAPDAYTIKLRVNGADSNDGSGNPLACTIVADNTTGNDTTHEISVAAGDLVDMVAIPVDTPTSINAARCSMVFAATTDGESLILGQSSDVPTNSRTEYNYLQTNRYNDSWGTTESFQGGQDPGDDMVLKKFYVKQSAASGDGKTWTYTVRGGGGSTNLVVAIAGAADTTGSDTNAAHSYTVAAYDDLAIMAVPTSSPAARMVYWGLVCYIAPAANITVTPSTLSLTITSYAPVNQLVIPVGVLAHTTTKYAPVIEEVTTPTTLAHTTTGYAPTLQENIPVGLLEMATTTYEPSIDSNVVVTPTTLAHTTTGYAPVIKEVTTPSTLAHTTTGYAPVIEEVTTPTTLAHTTTGYAPVIEEVTTPTTLAHTTTGYAPTLQENIPVGLLEMATTTYEPSIDSNVVVTPTTLAHTATGYAPVMKEVTTPSTLAHTTTAYAPVLNLNVPIPVACNGFMGSMPVNTEIVDGCFLYRANLVWYLYNIANQTTYTITGGLPHDSRGGYLSRRSIIFEGTNLIVGLRNSTDHQVEVRTYTLSGTTYTLASTEILGNTSSDYWGGVLKLANGTLLCYWYHPVAVPEMTEEKFSYRNLSGAWSTVTYDGDTRSNGTESIQMGVAQDPTGVIWVFYQHDSYHVGSLLKLTEDGTTLSVDSFDVDFFLEDTEYEPENENPSFRCRPCSDGVIVAYQNDHFTIHEISPAFLKGAGINVVKVTTDGTKSILFETTPSTVERCDQFGLIMDGDTPSVVYRAYSATDHDFTDYYIENAAGKTYLGNYSGPYKGITGVAWPTSFEYPYVGATRPQIFTLNRTLYLQNLSGASLTSVAYAPTMAEQITPAVLAMVTAGYAPVVNLVVPTGTLAIRIISYEPVITGIGEGEIQYVILSDPWHLTRIMKIRRKIN